MDQPVQTDVVAIGMGPGGAMPHAYPTFNLAIKDAPHNLDLS
jgi:hypothetical protein